MCLAKDLKILYALLNMLEEDIRQLEKVRLELYNMNKERKKITSKHSGVMFIVLGLLFSLGFFIVLKMAYSVMPEEFNYVLLAPVFGFLVEFVLRKLYIKKERKAVLKSVSSSIKRKEEEAEEILDGIRTVYEFAESKRRMISGGQEKKFLRNKFCIEYILKNDTPDDLVINMDKAYAEFECKYSRMKNYPDLKSLGEKIRCAQTQVEYTDLLIKHNPASGGEEDA